MTFDQFQKTRQQVSIVDYCAKYGTEPEEHAEAKTLYEYKHGLHIEIRPAPECRYYAEIDRDEHRSNDLQTIEQVLYQFYITEYEV